MFLAMCAIFLFDMTNVETDKEETSRASFMGEK